MRVGIETSIATAIALGSTAGGGGGDCDWPDCFPDATNTGVPAGTSLSAYAGPANITVNDTVIDSKTVNVTLTINATGVIIRNSQITPANTTYSIQVQTGSLLVEDCDITCGGQNGTCLGDFNMTVRRCDISACENGFNIGGTMTAEDNYIHDLVSGGGAHTDGMQFNQGASNINVIHNTIIDVPGGNSCIIMWDGANPQGANILIEHNRLLGQGVNYTVYTPRTAPLTNVKVINNRFGIGGSGYNGGDGTILTDATGNVDDVTGDPISLA